MSNTKIVKRRDGSVLIHTDTETARQIANELHGTSLNEIADQIGTKIGGATREAPATETPAGEAKIEEVAEIRVEDTEAVPA